MPRQGTLSKRIIAYWKSVLPVEHHDEQSLRNYEAVAHTVQIERGMKLQEARESIRPLYHYDERVIVDFGGGEE